MRKRSRLVRQLVFIFYFFRFLEGTNFKLFYSRSVFDVTRWCLVRTVTGHADSDNTECRTQISVNPEGRIRISRTSPLIQHYRPFIPATLRVRLHQAKTNQKVNEVSYKSFLRI